MAQQRYKGQAGMGGRGKNQPRNRQDVAGEHRYFFRLYALDTVLDLPPGSTRPQVEQEMKGHVLETAELMGRYAAAGEPVETR